MQRLFIFLALGFLTACGSQQEIVSFDNAWIRPTPPNSSVAAGYGVIANNTGNDAKLVAAYSPMFSSIEFHKTEHTDGMAKMLRFPTLDIRGGEQLNFKPGGYHLMMFNPEKQLKAGNKVWVCLEFADGRLLEQYIDVSHSPKKK